MSNQKIYEIIVRAAVNAKTPTAKAAAMDVLAGAVVAKSKQRKVAAGGWGDNSLLNGLPGFGVANSLGNMVSNVSRAFGGGNQPTSAPTPAPKPTPAARPNPMTQGQANYNAASTAANLIPGVGAIRGAAGAVGNGLNFVNSFSPTSLVNRGIQGVADFMNGGRQYGTPTTAPMQPGVPIPMDPATGLPYKDKQPAAPAPTQSILEGGPVGGAAPDPSAPRGAAKPYGVGAMLAPQLDGYDITTGKQTAPAPQQGGGGGNGGNGKMNYRQLERQYRIQHAARQAKLQEKLRQAQDAMGRFNENDNNYDQRPRGLRLSNTVPMTPRNALAANVPGPVQPQGQGGQQGRFISPTFPSADSLGRRV